MRFHVNPMPKTRLNDLMMHDPRLKAWSTIETIDRRITWAFEGEKPVFRELLDVVARERLEAEREAERTAREAETNESAYSNEGR
jgi:hypothetical protein